MGKLIVKRKSELINSMRNIEICLDKSVIGIIKNGETKEFDIQPGTYFLKAQIDWCRSEIFPLEVEGGEIKTVELSGYSNNRIIIGVMVVIAVLILLLRFLFNMNLPLVIQILFGACLGYMIYQITFGRNKYLRLKSIG